MKLTSIKAHGFKSFADKIEININDGITGIVGPNGSGKSNVVDAVKWVLGSSSLKDIRGGEIMSDVIFTGSASRKPSTRAWVSLTFSNEDHYLNIEEAEVEVKRVVYRNGENEYFINNSKVRKKDITDLFIDSGASSSSFSIISQGKISEILKGKPIDRRVIIEEAASVLKYKKRKEETLRKLDNTNDNLEKVELIINELSSSIEPLKEQSIKAKKYIEYRDELKDIEISLISHDIKTLYDEVNSKKAKANELNELILNMDTTSNVDNSKLETLKQDNNKLDIEIDELNKELLSLSEELSELNSKKQLITERRKYEVEDQKLESNIILLKEEKLTVSKNIEVIKSEIEVLEKKQETKTSTLDKLNEDYKLATSKKTTLLKELENKNKEEIIIKNKIDDLNNSIENDTKVPFAVKSVLNNPRLEGIHDCLSKLIEIDEKYTVSLEIALGFNANVIVVDNPDKAVLAINYLKENTLGRATFYPLSVIKGRVVDLETIKICKETAGYIDTLANLVRYNPIYKEIINKELGTTLVVDNINTLKVLGKKINYKYRIVSLDGEISHSGGSITGGKVNKPRGIFNLKYDLEKELKSHENIIHTSKLIEEHLNEIDHDLKSLENNIIDTKRELISLESMIDQKKVILNDSLKHISNIDEELKGTENVLGNSVDNELDEVMNKCLSVSTKKEQLNIKLSDLKTTRNDLLSEISELESTTRELNSTYNKYQKELTAEQIEIGKIEIKLDNLLNRLSEEYELTYQAAIKEYSLDMDINLARNKVNSLKRLMKELNDVNLGSIEEYERVNERFTFLTKQKEDLDNAINNLLEIINDLDETMKNKFKSTFDAVNLEFSKVFKKLFKGGVASLELTDPFDLLNTGIEIKALPPGKSIKSINALSGGEMTLTAIALLFSILNIRVVPFCILDEVEAALDEANVDTFGEYIKEYEHNSQFIVITHKKRTMEYVNTLYGITMQESGVSKLVSVKLTDIDE